MLCFSSGVALKGVAQGALRRVTQWPWIEHPTFQLRGGHSTTDIYSYFLTDGHSSHYLNGVSISTYWKAEYFSLWRHTFAVYHLKYLTS